MRMRRPREVAWRGVNAADSDAALAAIVTAYVGPNARLTTGASGQDVNVTANSTGTATATADGVTVGGLVAAGINQANATVNGGTSTVVDHDVIISSDSDINITATSAQNSSAEAGANAYSLLVAAASTEATALRNSPVVTEVNDNAHLTAANNITISAGNSTTKTHSQSSNDGGGIIGIGLPTAKTTISDSTTATLGANAIVTATAGNFTLEAQTNDTGIDSVAPAKSGGFIGASMSIAMTTVSDPATAEIGSSTQVTAGGNIVVQSTLLSTPTSNATADSRGVVPNATANASTTGTARLRRIFARA